MLRRDERDRGRGRIYAGLTIVARRSAVGYHGARLIFEHPFAVIRASAADACRDGPKVRHVIDRRLDWIRFMRGEVSEAPRLQSPAAICLANR